MRRCTPRPVRFYAPILALCALLPVLAWTSAFERLTLQPESTLRVTGSYPLNMKDYDVKPPTPMFGRIKVGESVTVTFDLLLKS